MSELQFVRVEGDSIVVKSPDGVEFQLPVDDILRGELRQTASPRKTQSNLSPRAIQDAIRAGKTVQELSDEFDTDAAYIEKFAQPVLDELLHVIASAKSVRINLAGDRFTDVTQIDFGDLIESRLSATGGEAIVWSSKRQDLTTWLVTVKYQLASGNGHATWSFDPRKLTLSPENEAALTLSSAEPLSDGPIPRLRPVSSEAPKKAPVELARETEKPQENLFENQTSAPVQVEGAAKSQQATEKIEVPSRSTIKEAIARATVDAAVDPQSEAAASPSDVVGEALPDPANLLDALRRKRREREDSEPDALPHKASGAARPLIPLTEPEPVTTSIRIINDETLAEAEASQLPQTEPEDLPNEPTTVTAEIDVVQIVEETAQPKPEAKKGRAGIPSWDEIVFGTKTDD